eukprot:TRINITY_DN3623_c2_g2_i1.p1 TRINITY_DN3623_c2_g2~~TRINITY_DN3623_c2_g2_i1.p1  ORF type:complete len:248 (+),score=62.43 TRINITY_DN3623_c2_g2_i1:315-1058(+)
MAAATGSPRRAEGPRMQTLFDNLVYPVDPAAAPSSKHDQAILRSASKRVIFHRTPENAHLDLGKEKNELEMLVDKFQPEFEQIVPALCDALNAVLVSHNLASRRRSRMSEAGKFSIFETSAVPEISLEDYLWRVVDYCYISPSTMVLACMLIDRLILNHGLMVTNLNVFKLFFTSVRVASKVHELRSLSNKNFATVGGVSASQLNALEAAYVSLFGWKLWVDHEEFVRYCGRLSPPGRPPNLPKVAM